MIKDFYKASENRYSNLMEYRRCGNSGIKLPVISLGLWHNFGDVDTLSYSRKKILFSFDRGITHFDLANNYGPSYGSAEETFGTILKNDLRPYRDEIIISTKAGHDMWPGPYGEWGSRKHIMASIDQSLKRLQTEYIDIFYSHRYDPQTPLEETLQALVDIVRQGKALYVGISKYPVEAADFAYNYLKDRDTPCLIYQGKYNILDSNKETDEILTQASSKGVGFIAFSPLAQGLLSDRYLDGIPADSRIARGGYLKKENLTPEILNKIKKLSEIAEKRGQTLSQMALAWCLKDDKVCSVIIGASSTSQIETNLEAIKHTSFSLNELNQIQEIANKQ